MKTSLTAAAILTATLFAGTASAADPSGDRPVEKPTPSRFHVDLETDPTAFVFSGWSLHAGLGWKHVRLDLGVYAMDVPGFVETNKGFDASFRGAGAKLQLFLFDEQKGGFVGIDAGLAHLRADLQGSAHHASQNQTSTGVNFGWRFSLPYGLYATPWLGIGYSFDAKDMNVDGRTYRPNPVTIFPAVHLGYRFM